MQGLKQQHGVRVTKKSDDDFVRVQQRAQRAQRATRIGTRVTKRVPSEILNDKNDDDNLFESMANMPFEGRMYQKPIALRFPTGEILLRSTTLEDANLDEEMEKSADQSDRIGKKSNSGARVTKKNNFGARVTKKNNFGARVTKKANFGARVTKKANFGARVTKKS